MSVAVGLSTDIAGRMLSELCARNHTAELVFKIEGKPEIRAKVRFLDMTDSELWVDCPTVGGQRADIPADVAVRLFFRLEDDFFSFVSRPLGRASWFSRSAVEIAALRIEKPAEIERNQRRSCYRLSMLPYPWALARFQVIPDERDAEPETVEAAIRNLSETGCGITTPPAVAARLRVGQHCRAAIQLPGQEDIFEIPGKFRWIHKNKNGHQSMLGLAWQWDEFGLEAKIVQSRLARFIMSEQLEALRRRRLEAENEILKRPPHDAVE